ncbi:MAG TPA: bi-domain-containing oxidoreductase, partial [Anaerolineales bacterium]
MKQLLQNIRSGATEVEDVPVPSPKPGTALVQTGASLVSAGTERMVVEFAEKSLLGKARSRPDLVRQVIDKARREGLLSTIGAVFNRLEQPMPLGYSSAGTIVTLGEGLQGFQVGQRVACAGGGHAVHAEYNVVPQNLLSALPDGVDFESAAFTTLGAIAMHGYRLAETQIGERVAVIGLGLLGLLAAGIARAAGCMVLGIDLDPGRVALAHQMGIKGVLRDQAEETAGALTRGKGMDAVLICADTPSADPVELAGAIARDRGKVVAVGSVGLKLPRKVYYEKELSFINSRSYGPGRYDPTYEQEGQDYPIGYVRWTEGRNMEAFVELLASSRLDVKPLITHRFPIERAPEAYELITGKAKEPFLGVILTYPGASESSISLSSAPASRIIQYEVREAGQVSSVKLGVLGAGNFASVVMLPVLKKMAGIEMLGVASASGVSAAQAARRFGFRYATSQESDVLSDPSINTVAILTRHHLHASQVISALDAGKNVFCEKPLALTREELEDIAATLVRINEKQDEVVPLLMVGFNRRFSPMAKKLQAFLADRHEPLVAHYRVNAGYIP